MKQRKLGHTDVMVSEMGLGCMSFGPRISEAEFFKRMNDYVELGGNFFDTANIYGRSPDGKSEAGESERIIGRWLKETGKRQDIVLASKVGFPYPGIAYGTTRKQIREECEKTLEKLQTDYLDLYYLHTDDFNAPMEESLEALQELIQEGKVRHIGASNFSAWRLERSLAICREHNWEPFCCVQQRHSYLRPKQDSVFGQQKYVDLEMREFLKDTGMTLIAYCPLIKGAYVQDKGFPGQYISEDSRIRLQTVREISEESGISVVQLVYYWLMHTDPSAIPLVSSSTDEQFRESMKTLEIDASAYMQQMSEASDGHIGPDFRTAMKF